MNQAATRFRAQVARAAALGLLIAACEDKPDAAEPVSVTATPAQATLTNSAGKAKDCCMGLNACKGRGGCGVPESHDCAGKNSCRGKGGCNMHCPQ